MTAVGLAAAVAGGGGLATAAGAADSPAPTQTSDQPNIIMILADDLGYSDTSMYGGAINTPNIAALADSGVTFTNAYASAPVCAPSRLGLLTGDAPESLGADSNWLLRQAPPEMTPDPPGPTMAEVLKDQGYSTAAVGKWDVSGARQAESEDVANSHPNLPDALGFDQYYGMLNGIGGYCPENQNNTFSYDADADWYRSVEPDKYLTDEFSDRAADFVGDEAPQDDPFFLYLAYNAPHAPLHTRTKCDPPGNDEDERRSRYTEMVQILDEGIGNVMDRLDAADGVVGNQATDPNVQNTMIVFTSDHGPEHAWQTGPLRDRKYSLFEGGVRVPMSISWPAELPAGGAYDKVASHLDLMPTFGAAAGSDQADGHDLVPAVIDGSGTRTDLSWRYNSDSGNHGVPLGTARAAFRQNDAKLVRDVTADGTINEYVFDLDRDYDGDGEPDGFNEQHNESANPAYAETKQHLRRGWQNWAAQISMDETFRFIRDETGLPDGWASTGGTWTQTDDEKLALDATEAVEAWAPNSYYKDAEVAADVSVTGAGGQAGLVLRGSQRATDPGQLNGYLAMLDAASDKVSLVRVDDGQREVVATAPAGVDIGEGTAHRLGAKLDESTVTLALDGQQLIDWTDPDPYGGGYVGVQANQPAVFDNLVAAP